MKFLSSLLLSLLVITSAHAKEVGGVQLKPSIEEDGKTLNLNGAGIRSKFFVDVYVASLYTTQPEKKAAPILDGEILSAVRLDIISGLITSDKMVSTVEEGFKEATDGNVAPLQERINTFMQVFSKTEIKKGESFTLVGIPKVGVTAYRNGKEVITIQGDDFRKALFAIWLGHKPASKTLKKELLAG
ncbi:chalcone isomerase family protein [Parendozoicomonas haliclonae]|uniref:Chalcone-flavanone isomerase n=1 Tax=Parendozoicomonas haliclonae TaxID=1960125 RepID=A0A1X7AE64_9GAMM|nr:chalcone isomerase family protein [Parendozoicomonas haliclonae]SMA32570.1 Chalcone-flavanone isomerase [Parendozoicomonas haliclonae]